MLKGNLKVHLKCIIRASLRSSLDCRATLKPVDPTETDSAAFMRSKSLDSGVTECCSSSEETTDLNPAGGERVKDDEGEVQGWGSYF